MPIDCAFAYCSGITNITIPDGVISIGYRAFYNCSGLTKIYYKGSESEWGTISIDFYNEKLKNVPKILETPYIEEYPPYKLEIEMILTKKFNPNLYEDVKTI